MDKIKKGVRLDHISKIYQDPKTGKDFYAVKDTSLTIEPGSFVTVSYTHLGGLAPRRALWYACPDKSQMAKER